MIEFFVNGIKHSYDGDPNKTLLKYLRDELHLTSVKDGCNGQAFCGSCTVEINGKPTLSCRTKMSSLQGAKIITTEGLPDSMLDTIAKAFVNEGAVQCGFCTPGFVMRTKALLEKNNNPTLKEVQKALRPNFCRCTGYKKIEKAVIKAAEAIRTGKEIQLHTNSGKLGEPLPKYGAYEAAIGLKKFVADIYLNNMLFGALKFSDYPRAKVIKIDTSQAEKLPGVIRVFTAKDLPAAKKVGLIHRDWDVMIAEGEVTHYIGDVLAGVVAETEEIARRAVSLIEVEYEDLTPVTDVFEAMKDEIKVHEDKSNIVDISVARRGDVEKALQEADFVVEHRYQTQRIEHAFLEPEACVARPDGDGIIVFSQSQGVYEDQRQVADILGIDKEKVRVILIPNGGGFGGKEDLSIQGHTALFAYLLGRPVKITLTREESIRLHPKRHPVTIDIKVAANKDGKLTAVQVRAYGDTGAYLSVGNKVMERVTGHATGGYYVPNVDIKSYTVYTNNVPCGAMRGFGANQVTFALEAAVDELCEKAGFDRWQFRYDNALEDGLQTGTGQRVYNVGLKQCLLALKDKFYSAKYAGLAMGIKNVGIGNGMIDESKAKIEILSETHIVIKHGWTEMGQGVNTVAIQMLCETTGLPPEIMEVVIDTEAEIPTGMTTASRATTLLGNAVKDAGLKLKADLEKCSLKDLVGKTYLGQYVCDWTEAPGENKKDPVIHLAYGYAAQLCVLDDNGNIAKIYAAHDVGRIVNPLMVEGQIEGAVAMGTGYALSEDLPMENGRLISDKMKDLGLLRIDQVPEIEVIPVEVPDRHGPYGAKGIGEIGLVPTAPAIVNALYQYDGIRRYRLPIEKYYKK